MVAVPVKNLGKLWLVLLFSTRDKYYFMIKSAAYGKKAVQKHC